MDQNFSFLIEHKTYGTILYHPSSETLDFSEILNFPVDKADILILGAQKLNKLKELQDNVLTPFRVKTIIPVHYDNFFKPLKRGVIQLTTNPFSSKNICDLESKFKKESININFQIFRYYGDKNRYKWDSQKESGYSLVMSAPITLSRD